MQSALEGEGDPLGFPPARLLVVAACVVLVAAAGAPSASAHARLLRTIPAQGAVLGRAPGQISFVFDEAVRSASPAKLSGGTLNGAVTAPARLEPGGRRVVVRVPGALGRGVYAVAWRVVSDDGHLEVGTLAFGVGVRPTGVAATASSATPTDWALTLARWAFLFGLLAAAGLGVARLALGATPPARTARALASALALCAAGAAGELARVPESLDTRFGYVTAAAGSLALLTAGVAAAAARRPRLLTAAGVAALPLVAAQATAGHALSPGRPVALAYAAELVHACAAAAWLGIVLWVLLTPARRALLTGGRMTRAVGAVVLVLGGSGVTRAAAELTSADQLISSSYGRLLLVKTGVFAALLAVGWLNRERLGARPLGGEAALVAAAALVVALLNSATPPRALARAEPALGPATVFAREAGARAVGIAARRAPGGVEVDATVIGADGSPEGGLPVEASAGGGFTSARACGAGRYCARLAAGAAAPLLRVRVAGTLLTARLPARPQAARAAALVRADGIAIRSLRSLVIREHLAASPTNSIDTVYRIAAPDRLAYVTSRGDEAIVVGGRRWDRTSPTAPWVESEQDRLQLPALDWFRVASPALLGEGVVGGQPVWRVSFEDPTVPAWFELAIEQRTHRQLRVRMVAAAHFMSRDYGGFDAPLTIRPPARR